MKYKLSQWHNGSVNPVHIGVYRVNGLDIDPNKFYSYWDSKVFNGHWWSIERALKEKDFGTCSPTSSWMGIIK